MPMFPANTTPQVQAPARAAVHLPYDIQLAIFAACDDLTTARAVEMALPDRLASDTMWRALIEAQGCDTVARLPEPTRRAMALELSRDTLPSPEACAQSWNTVDPAALTDAALLLHRFAPDTDLTHHVRDKAVGAERAGADLNSAGGVAQWLVADCIDQNVFFQSRKLTLDLAWCLPMPRMLPTLGHLRHLRLRGVPVGADLSCLAQMPQLEQITLYVAQPKAFASLKLPAGCVLHIKHTN
jgi:hypothetical protein